MLLLSLASGRGADQHRRHAARHHARPRDPRWRDAGLCARPVGRHGLPRLGRQDCCGRGPSDPSSPPPPPRSTCSQSPSTCSSLPLCVKALVCGLLTSPMREKHTESVFNTALSALRVAAGQCTRVLHRQGRPEARDDLAQADPAAGGSALMVQTCSKTLSWCRCRH